MTECQKCCCISFNTLIVLLTPMKVLITGSNGLLGQKLIDYYLKHPSVQLTATAKGVNRHPVSHGYTYYTLDITSEHDVMNVMEECKPDVVIHAAAMTNVDACETNREACDMLNVLAVEYIVRACNRVNAHLVHLSTDFIFDGTHGPLHENETPNPLSYYGHSKYRGEQLVQENSQSWAIARTVLVYGVVSDMSRSNIVLWVKNSLEQNKSIRVVCDQFRTPTLAEDLASGCALIAAKRASGIYHISGSEFISVFDLAYQVADFWQLDKSLLGMAVSKDIKQPAQRPPVTGFHIQKAIRELGYQPHSIQEGLALIDQQLKHMQHELG